MTVAAPFYTNVTQKGQVTLPVEYRQVAGIAARDKVAITLENGQISIRPVKSLDHFYGKIKPSRNNNRSTFNIDSSRKHLEENYLDEDSKNRK